MRAHPQQSMTPRIRAVVSGLKTRSASHIGGATSRAGLILLAFSLVVFFQVETGGFATSGHLISILVSAAITLVASIAMARLIIAGHVDLSIGGMYAVIAVVSASVMRDTQNVLLGVLTALGLGLLFGLVNGWLVLTLRISPLIVTLALAGMYAGFALVLTKSFPVSGLPVGLSRVVRATVVADVPMSVVIALVVFALGSIALTRTVGGVRTYAIGGDAVAAERLGVNTNRHVLMLFAYMGVSMGIVAIITVGRLQSASPLLGTGFEFQVITAVILGGVSFGGGTGRPIGVLFGVLTIAIVNTGLIFINATDYWQTIVSGGILLLALAADQINERRINRVKRTARERTATSTGMEALGDAGGGKQLRSHTTAGPVVLQAEHLSKTYGAVTAVSDISLRLRAGHVTCLLGDNGAGKSTLIKMLSGVVSPDSGEMRLEDRNLNDLHPDEIREAGVETVYQDLAVCPNLGAAINLSLGREPRKGWSSWLGSLALFDRAGSIADATERMAKLGVQLDDYSRPVRNLSGGQRQCVAIARTITDGVRVVILDEPTAALGVRQKSLVLRLARRLADDGAAVVVITHDAEAVELIADHVIVMNLGRVSYEGPAGNISSRELVHLMAGFPLEDRPTTNSAAPS